MAQASRTTISDFCRTLASPGLSLPPLASPHPSGATLSASSPYRTYCLFLLLFLLLILLIFSLVYMSCILKVLSSITQPKRLLTDTFLIHYPHHHPGPITITTIMTTSSKASTTTGE